MVRENGIRDPAGGYMSCASYKVGKNVELNIVAKMFSSGIT